MAVRITFKRSSIFNKRPNAELLDPGEIALNTNSLSPGLFFEADNNSVVKVGPTAVGLNPPTLSPSLGEMFFDEGDGSLKIGSIDPETASKVWKDISTPYLGGTNGYVVFVAPEFPNASDAIENDGQAIPFKTLNRAAIEIAKISIAQLNESDAAKNDRYTIVVAPGICPIINGPGLPYPTDTAQEISQFDVIFEGKTPDLPLQPALRQFNSETGGLLIPRGTSIVGMDLRKVEFRPTYVPTYINPTTGLGKNEPVTGILKWTGNSYFQNFTFRDKRSEVLINLFKTGPSGEGIFVCSRPHCFSINDRVFFQFAPGADQTPITEQSAGVLSGFYYVYPQEVNTFYLSTIPINGSESNYIERAQLPSNDQSVGYIASCTWESYSHNRLRAIYPASKEELNVFYKKVQKAFPLYFNGSVNQAEVVNPGETELVGPVPTGFEQSILSNTTDNASPYVNEVSVRSNYGMCGLEQNGQIVSGFKSALVGSFSVVSIQNDPAAYEVYTTVQDPVTGDNVTDWYTLQYATWASIPPASRPPNPGLVTRAQQLALLNNIQVSDIRYYYTTLKSTDKKSYGLPDFENDFRHFAIRSFSDAYVQVATSWAVGCAVGYWAYGGGRLSATGCATNFGLNALRSEGYQNIGSGSLVSYVDPADSNFQFTGIRMPDRLLPRDTTNYQTIELGGSVRSVTVEDGVQLITIGPGFQPINILPYSLAPNTAIYANGRGSTTFRAFFVDDGLPTTIFDGTGNTILRVRLIDSTFPVGGTETNPDILNWSGIYIKRWLDPRDISEASYSLILTNTQPTHRPPAFGSILRLNQNSQTASIVLRQGVQLDPGPMGGWGRVFQVAYSESSIDGDSPQYNEVLLNRNTSNEYYVGLSLCDSARPWLETQDHAHGTYVTHEVRNWYAACNDDWDGVYYNNVLDPTERLKLEPTEFNSPWATSFSSELQELVENTYQGTFAQDPDLSLYPDGYYFRGDVLSFDNYGFELIYNKDNGTPNFGLLRNTTNSGVVKQTTEELKPTMDTVTVNDVTDIPNPFKSFVVMKLTSGDFKPEYVQVIGVNETTKTLTLIRGLYDSATTVTWPVGATMTLQIETQEVLPEEYDRDWSISKSAMIRFLKVMGYSDVSIKSLLYPRYSSQRNIEIRDISVKPEKNAGYATSTGPWPLEFASPSKLDSISHSFYGVGRLNYSRGLPKYLRNEIPTKQYYDYLSTRLWGGNLILSGADELGNQPTNGVSTESETGRPSGTYTSDIKNGTRNDPGPGEGGGGGGGDGVQAIYTGLGLTGGPIFAEGTISLVPPTRDTIGGVKAGANITISPDGTISSQASTGGTVTSIDFIGGLTGGTITKSGVVSVNVGVGLRIAENGSLAVKPGSAGEIGGVKAGTAISISSEGSISVLPPAGPVIGGVKQGDGVTIQPDGTISVNSTPSAGIVLLDDLQFQFNGTKTQFTLTVAGKQYTPFSSQSVLITVGNIPQPTPTAYTVAGSTITFTSPPPAGAAFYGIGLSGTLQSLPTSGMSVSLLDDISSQFNGTATEFTLKVNGTPFKPPASYYALITVGAVVQSTPDSYIVTGSTITFTSPPPAGADFYGIAFG